MANPKSKAQYLDLLDNPPSPIIVNVYPPNVTIHPPDITVHPPNVTVEAPTVNVTVEVEEGWKAYEKTNLTADGSEQTLIEATGLELLEGYVDLGNMELGDTVVIKQYVKIEEGGNYKLCDNGSYGGVQVKPVLHFVTKICDLGIHITLQQTTGTFKRFPHSFYQRRL